MNPVPLWFAVVGAIAGFSIFGYVIFVMARERRNALPDELRLAIDDAYRIQVRLYERGADEEKLNDVNTRVRMLMSRAYARDHDAVRELLAGLEEE